MTATARFAQTRDRAGSELRISAGAVAAWRWRQWLVAVLVAVVTAVVIGVQPA